MTLEEAVAGVLWIGVTLYAVLGGADFGGGFWDLCAGGTRRGWPQRKLIEGSMGPVWEANHVWMIFAAVTLWTGFPRAFSSVMTTMWIPLLLASFGIILRGAAFAFRKPSPTMNIKRVFGITFALSSVVTPFFMGMVAGGVASGRVPLGNAAGDTLGAWVNPTAFLGGVLAVATCAHLAAVYLTLEARGRGLDDLAEAFRVRALVSGLGVGALTLVGIEVLRRDAPMLFAGLTGRAIVPMVLSAAGGLTALWLLWTRRYASARVAAALSVAMVIWGWGVGQYPDLLPGELDLHRAAAHPAVLRAMLWTVGVGTLLLAPSLWLLFALFRPRPER